MDCSTLVTITSFFTFLAGIVVATLAGRWLNPAEQKSRELEKHLKEAREQLKDYENKVTTHFDQTAVLLNNVVKGYRDIHNHLASGAQELCPRPFDAKPIIPKLPGSDTADDDDSASAGKVKPPLDYAPRNNPYEQGTLDESYGLEKVNLHTEDKDQDDAGDGNDTADPAKRPPV